MKKIFAVWLLVVMMILSSCNTSPDVDSNIPNDSDSVTEIVTETESVTLADTSIDSDTSITDDTVVDATTDSDTSAEDTTIAETTDGDTSAEDTTIAETTDGDTSAEDTTIADTTNGDTSVEDTTIADTTDGDTSTEGTIEETLIESDTSTEDTTITETNSSTENDTLQTTEEHSTYIETESSPEIEITSDSTDTSESHEESDTVTVEDTDTEASDGETTESQKDEVTTEFESEEVTSKETETTVSTESEATTNIESETTTNTENETQTPDINTDCTDGHKDLGNDGYCDDCGISVIIFFDIFAINDLHGKFDDTDANIGVDELTSYLKAQKKQNEYTLLFSSGDMWQGSSESNLTKGKIVTEWMNALDFVSMTLGNHEYDWGEEYVIENSKLANFPFLAINVYDRATNKPVDYCQSSTVIDYGSVQIGIIGAIGDCYSSISSDKTEGIYFKVGSELTSLVKAEAQKLRSEGVDFIIYSIHDGYDKNSSGSQSISSSSISSYYSSELSSGGYIDMVFEGHTHKSYTLIDQSGVYHFQNGGDNNGISHAEISINIANFNSSVESAEIISYKVYGSYTDDPIVDALLEKYKDEISKGTEILGTISKTLSGETIKQLVAKLYYEFGVKTWGDKYNIVLGGGFLNVRSPYNIYAGDVKYSDIQSVLPFDNNLVLCSIKGKDLKNKFFETTNSNYYISYGDYGASVKNNIDPNATYYVIVDSYTSSYKYNNLTEIARIDEEFFARDLLAEYIKNGNVK